MSIDFSVSNYFDAHTKLAQQLDFKSFEDGIKMVEDAFNKGKKIFTCGNGGSASTASHYITDWTKMVYLATGKKFRGISLCDNIGIITAYGNDLSYDDVFSGQLGAMMDEGDLLIVVSGSGNSANVVKAVEEAHSIGGNVLGILGYDGGKLLPMCNTTVLVESFDMQLCEDVHLMFGHMVMKHLCQESLIQ